MATKKKVEVKEEKKDCTNCVGGLLDSNHLCPICNGTGKV